MPFSRRTLLKGISLATFGGRASGSIFGQDRSSVPAWPNWGLALENLRQIYRKELHDELDDWDRHGVDFEHGGMTCSLDHDGTLLNSEKSNWYQGRGLWVYSFLYNHIKPEPRYLKIARGIKEFLFRYARQGDGTWPIELSRVGKITRPFNGRIYGGMFVALGLQEYYAATGEEEVMDEGVRTFLQCMELYDRPTYGSTFREAQDWPPGTRIQGVEMVTIDLLFQMVARSWDSRLQHYLDRAVEAVLERFFNPEFELNNEYLRHDYSRYQDEYFQYHVWLGHSIETLMSVKQRRQKCLYHVKFPVPAARDLSGPSERG